MTGRSPSRRRFLSGLLWLPPLTGCSLLFPQTPPQIYRLLPRVDSPLSGPLVHGQLVVVAPVAPQSLDTDRIALTRSRTTLDYFAGSVWTDRAAIVLQTLLIEAFENSGRINAVGRDSSGIMPDYVLETTLREFEANYAEARDQPPNIRIAMFVQLVKMPSRQNAGGLLATQQTSAERNDLGSIVDAFDTAVGRVLAEVVTWTLRLMARTR